MIYSFGALWGINPPSDVPIVDCRVLRDPITHDIDRKYAGTSSYLQNRLKESPRFSALLDEGRMLHQRFGAVAFMCSGGRHRSVALAEVLAEEVQDSITHLAKETWPKDIIT